MKSFKDFKLNLDEAVPQQPQQQPNASDANDAKKQAAVKTQRLRAAAMKAKVPFSQTKTAYDKLQKLIQQRPNVPVNRLTSTLTGGKYLAALQNKFPLDALNADQQTYMKAYRNISALEEQADASNPPAVLNLRRTGVRVFPDGRKVALYVNKQLGLVFSVPYAGTGQTPGEIIPTVQVQATNEEVDSEDKGEYDYEGDMAISQLKSIISNSMKLKDMLEPDTNLPEWVQAKITLAEDYVVTAANYMEGQQDNQGAGDELDESAASFIAHMKAAMQAKDEEIKTRHLLKAKDARLSMTNAEIAKYRDLLNQHREMMSEEVEELDEATGNVRVVGKKKIIKARIRGGKVQRRKVVSAVPGYKMVGGQVKRESAKERLDRKRGARKAKIKRRAKLARALIKRKRSLRKRKAMGL